jgi:SSS family solute:Na+ symporter
LWSIDIYRRRLRPEATDQQVVAMGKKAIMVTLATGLTFGFVQVYVKFSNPEFALTHWFNDMSYYIKVGFVILIASAVFLYRARPNLVLAMMFVTIGIKLLLEQLLPNLAYFNITALTILSGYLVVALDSWVVHRKVVHPREIWHAESRGTSSLGALLLASLLLLQIKFH